MRFLRLFGWLVLSTLGAAASAQQDYPNKPIRFITPYAPGGSTTFTARLIGQHLTDAWGQQVVVDNRPGGNTTIGTQAAVRSRPDGYTIITIGSVLATNHTLMKTPYDALKDITPIATILSYENVLVVAPSLPVKTAKELIALAKSRPGQLTYASAGAGTTSHLAGELFKSLTKTDIAHIPYKGNVPAITDLMSGETQMLFATLPTVLPQVNANRLRGVAVLGSKRSAALPDMPTLMESGLPKFEVNNWTGLLAPAGTPAAVVSRLNTEANRVMQLPDVQARLPREGLRHVAMTPQQFGDFVRSEKEKWGPIVKATGAKAD